MKKQKVGNFKEKDDKLKKHKKLNIKSENRNKRGKRNIFLKGYDKFIKFLKWSWEDNSILSYVSFLILVFVFLKLIFFPVIGFVLNTNYPIVAIVSGSMEHKTVSPCYEMDRFGNCISENNNIYQICNVVFKEKQDMNFDKFWQYCGQYYETEYNLSKNQFSDFPYDRGLNIGDVMILYGKSANKIDVGDVIVFKPQDESFFEQRGPVIHRVVKKFEENGKIYFSTKGDHNSKSQEGFETKIPQENVIGTAVVRIPYIGLVKIYLTKLIGFFII